MTRTYYGLDYTRTAIEIGGKTYEVIRRAVNINVNADLDTYIKPVDAHDIVAIRAIWSSPTTGTPCIRELKLTARTARRVLKHITDLVLPTVDAVRALYRMDLDQAKGFITNINLYLLGLPDATEDSITDAYNYFQEY